MLSFNRDEFQNAEPVSVATFNRPIWNFPVTELKRRPSLNKVVREETPTDDTLPKISMALKIVASKYGMYLDFADRDKLFGELDYLLDPEGWCDEDDVPRVAAFENFLKWSIAAKALNWVSLGFNHQGNLLAAYKNGDSIVTAAFSSDAVVNWTSRFVDTDGVDTSSGRCPLISFVRTGSPLLERLSG